MLYKTITFLFLLAASSRSETASNATASQEVQAIRERRRRRTTRNQCQGCTSANSSKGIHTKGYVKEKRQQQDIQTGLLVH